MRCTHEHLDYFRRYVGVDVHPIKESMVEIGAEEFDSEADLDLGDIYSDEYEEIVHTWIRCGDCRELIWEGP
jgi:hypothetical protein